MNIEKNGKIYTVKECKDHWNVSEKREGISVCFKIDKRLCETAAELNEYVNNNDMF